MTNTVPGKPARGVDRVTALRGPELPAPRMTAKVQKRLSERLFIQDSDLPYAEPGESLGKMVLAVVERQDRLDDLECGRDPDDAGGS